IASSNPDETKLQGFGGTAVILGQKEWEQLAADWGIKIVPKVDFSKELLLIGTSRGTSFKFLSEVKNGDLIVEIISDKHVKRGFLYTTRPAVRPATRILLGRDLPVAVALEFNRVRKLPTGTCPGEVSGCGGTPPQPRVITTQKEWDTLVREWNIQNP